MYIIVNNQPVNVFKIESVSSIKEFTIADTQRLYQAPFNPDYYESWIKENLREDWYETAVEEAKKRKTLEEYRTTPLDWLIAETPLGLYFTFNTEGTIRYSSLYVEQSQAQKALEDFLTTINKITYELPQISI